PLLDLVLLGLERRRGGAVRALVVGETAALRVGGGAGLGDLAFERRALRRERLGGPRELVDLRVHRLQAPHGRPPFARHSGAPLFSRAVPPGLGGPARIRTWATSVMSRELYR